MKRLLAIIIVAAMLFSLIPGNAIAFAENSEMLMESRLGSEMGMLADRDISEEEWTVKLSDGTVVSNAKISSTQNVPIPLVGYTVEVTQADLDKLVDPSKRVKVFDGGHSIEVTMGKGQSFRKLDIGKSNKKDGLYTISFESLPLVKGSSIQKGVIVIKSEIVERPTVAWKLETTEGKPLEGTVKLDGDYYFVQVTRESLEKAVKKGETFLGINPSGGAVYSTKTDDGTSTESQKISDYTYHTATTSFFEYQFDTSKVSSSVLEGKIVFDLIAPNTEMFPKWTIKTKSGLDVPVDRQMFIDLAKEYDEPSLQNWAYYVYVNKNALKEELARQGHEFISLDINKTTVKLYGTQYQFDGTASEYFLDSNNFLDVDTLNEYSFAIQVNDTGKLIELKSAELYIDVTTKASKHKVTFNPNGGTLDGSTAVKEVEVDENTAVANPGDPAKDGYRFLYWAVGSEDGDQYSFDAPVKQNLKLVAKYVKIHKVIMNAKGGYLPSQNTVYFVESGQMIEGEVLQPTKTRHVFTEWLVDGKPFNPKNDRILSDVTAVAQYEGLPGYNGSGVELKLRYNGNVVSMNVPGNGGIVSKASSTKEGKTTYFYQGKLRADMVQKIIGSEYIFKNFVGMKAETVRAHYTFKNSKANEAYMVSPDGDELKPEYYEEIFTGDQAVRDFKLKVTLEEKSGHLEYASLIVDIEVEPAKKTYKVTFNPNGGTLDGSTAVKEVEVDENTAVANPGEPTRAGHTFKHWAVDTESGAVYNFATPVTGDLTLVAVYEANPAPIKKFKVTFNPNGGTLDGSTAVKEVEVDENTAVANPGEPTRAGHTFKHWAVGSEAGAAYNFASQVTGDLTLVAVYEVDNAGGNIGGDNNAGGNTGGGDNTGGNTGGTGSNQGSSTDFFPDTNTGSTGNTTGTVEIEEEEAPLSKVLSDDVLINGEKTALEIGKDGTIVVTEEDLKDVKNPILMSFKMKKGHNAFVTFQKSKEKEDIIPISMFFGGRMHVVIAGPGTYAAKDAAVAFRGVPEKHWATPFIQIVSARQLMVGNENGDFMPDMLTSRAMFTQILARLQFVDLTKVKSDNYVDVQSDKWYSASVNWATEQGIVNGVGEGKFAPEDATTREQIAVMIYNYLKLNNWNLKTKAGAAQFNDYDQVSEWAKDAVTALKDFGIFEGKPGYMFDPKAKVTRAEVATLVARLLEMYLRALSEH